MARAGFTASRLSAITRHSHRPTSPYFIPPTFLYKLKEGITPHVCQIAALSEVTGYRFIDWMRLCGFDLHQIPRLQAELHTERTVLITPIEPDAASFLRHFSGTAARTVTSMDFPGPSPAPWVGRYLFAKIGLHDAVVYPELRPGSVVRADRRYSRRLPHESAGNNSPLWLVEHTSGLTCCRVKWMDDQHVILFPSRPPLAAWPLRVPSEARILGIVDMEFRSANAETAQPVCRPMKFEQHSPVHHCKNEPTFAGLLRTSRSRTGLTFRAAHEMTAAAARVFGDQDYAIALGLLSDYEAMERLPRHAAKIISLCVVYCIDFWQLMKAGGVRIDDSGKMPLPMSVEPRALMPTPESMDSPLSGGG